MKRNYIQLEWSRQRGFTLLEILVAIVVLSIGLLGLAGLQVVSLNNNQIAYYRAIASQQAYDMADRIRANLVGVRAGNYNNLAAGLPGTNPDCLSANCTAANMTISDHRQWNTLNASLLPAGNGTVACAPGAGCSAATGRWIFDITVSWTEKNAAGNVTQSFVTRFTP
jgi:type IV pilus assembly protein PilV